MRLIIVARSDMVDKANAASKEVDIEGGERTFTVPLYDPSDLNSPVAYWCSWDMAATKHDDAALRSHFESQGFREANDKDTGASVAKDATLAVFRADEWTPQEVLDALGLVVGGTKP